MNKHKKSLLSTLYKDPLFLCIGVPTLLVGIYTTIIATDEMAASANVIVREENAQPSPAMPGITAAAFNFGTSTSLEDAYLLEAYLKSESFILKMNEALELDKHFSSAGFLAFIQRKSKVPRPGLSEL